MPDLLILIVNLLLGLAVLWLVFAGLMYAHELGHVLAMLKQGITVDRIVVGLGPGIKAMIFGIPHEWRLVPMFAGVHSHAYAQADPWVRAKIALAGPCASMLFGLVIYGVSWLADFRIGMIIGNGSMLLFYVNLLPFPPLDGGTILIYLLHKVGITLSKTLKNVLNVLGIVCILVITYHYLP